MSSSLDPLLPRPPLRDLGRTRIARHKGELLGVQYELGIQVSELTILESDTPPTAPLPTFKPLAGPAAQAPDPSAPDALGKWESEGGAVD